MGSAELRGGLTSAIRYPRIIDSGRPSRTYGTQRTTARADPYTVLRNQVHWVTLQLMLSHPRRRNRGRLETRIVGLVLLTGLFTLTSTPVCGAPVNLDPASCCERHACRVAAADLSRVHCATENRNSPGGNSFTPAEAPGGSGSVSQCCVQGRLRYPAARVQGLTSGTVTLQVVLSPGLSFWAPSSSFPLAVNLQLPLKISLSPIYTLTATYLI